MIDPKSNLAMLVQAFLVAMLAVACTDGSNAMTSAPPEEDVALDPVGEPDAQVAVGTSVDGMCAAEGPYGVVEGRTFRPFTLTNCADGEDFSFYNADYCESDTVLTVLSIAAGWCPPCIAESRQLTAQITEPYRSRGVRVIQAVVQKADFSAPDLAFCREWVDRFGLTNIEVLDPDGVLQVYFPGDSLPSTVIVDNKGVIRFRENGASEGLITLRTKLDELLLELE